MKSKCIVSTLIISVLLLLSTGCNRQDNSKKKSSFHTTEETTQPTLYDLEQIQESNELIAITLQGPDTYYEYKGKFVGLQFELAEAFANAIGVRLRMETARDTVELIKKLANGDADLVAVEIPITYPIEQDFLFAGTWSSNHDSLEAERKQWITRKTSSELTAALNKWYNSDIRTRIEEKEKTRNQVLVTNKTFRAPIKNRAKGVISDYDTHFARHARTIGWDWRLLAAQCYQESGYNPHACSWAGAIGLMQIMPGTAELLNVPVNNLYTPEINIKTAVRYIKQLSNTFNDIRDKNERINFVLAAYNGGAAHVRDAMTLTKKYGKNPYLWKDVEPFILKLAQPQFYNDADVIHGYMRGQETVDYVRLIQLRWKEYRSLIRSAIPTPSKKNSKGGYKSQVLSAEEMETKFNSNHSQNDGTYQ